MNRISRFIVILVWLFILYPLMAGNLFSMELVFKDTQYSFQTLRALGYAVSGGADIGEVLKTAYAIKEGDDESWYQEWMKTAQQREKAGDDFLARQRNQCETGVLQGFQLLQNSRIFPSYQSKRSTNHIDLEEKSEQFP